MVYKFICLVSQFWLNYAMVWTIYPWTSLDYSAFVNSWMNIWIHYLKKNTDLYSTMCDFTFSPPLCSHPQSMWHSTLVIGILLLLLLFLAITRGYIWVDVNWYGISISFVLYLSSICTKYTVMLCTLQVVNMHIWTSPLSQSLSSFVSQIYPKHYLWSSRSWDGWPLNQLVL